MATADIVLGIVLIVLGLRFGARTLPRSPLLGIAIPSAMESDEAWYAGHEAAAAPVVQGGALGVLGAVGAVIAAPSWGGWIACAVFAAVLGHVFGAILVCDKAAKGIAPETSEVG
jgi:hypothetical protein